MKILHLDIETTPNLAHVWGLWQQNVGLNQLLMSTQVLCWVAKWHGERELIFKGRHNTDPDEMISEVWKLLDEADVVVHYNGRRFDIPHLNREFVERGLTPPKPYKQVDLLAVAKKQFRFPSNKLEYVAKTLGIGQKVKHIGHELWIGCMNGDKKCWKMMEKYNRMDVILLEELYTKLLPWIPGHPIRGLYDPSDHPICRCGSHKIVKEGFAYTSVSKFQQYRCKDCGSWFRGRKNLADRTQVLSNVV